MIVRRWPGLLLVLYAATALPAAGADIGVSVENPRRYGHHVGDRIERTLHLQLPPDYRLERASLPSSGDTAYYWLEVADVAIEDGGAGGDTQVKLDYQLFYAPLNVEPRQLPALEVRAVNDAGDRLSARVPAFEFNMSPLLRLRPEAGFEDSEDGLLLADERPDPLPVAAPRRRALIALAVAALALPGWAWATDRLPGRRRGPFGRALRSLRRLRSDRDGARVTATAMREVHRAFDETAGYVVFAEDVDDFLDANPAFSDLHAEITAFFERSRHFFFGQASDGDGLRAGTLEDIRDLARRCRARELQA